MMLDVRDFVHTFDLDKVEAQEIAIRTASKLEAKHVKLIEVIESLGSYLRSEDVTIRSKALNYLSQVLAAVPANFLARQQLQVITEFLCERIHDGGAIAGLHTLQRMPRFNDELAVMTVRAILSSLQDLQTRPQSQRFEVFELFSALLGKHRDAVRSLGSETLLGTVDLVSGEKDPRNLMIVFSILRVMIAEWDISDHVEPVFDSVFCYFPITFRPPPDDPYGISAQDLKVRLRDCIAASSLFAPHLFPQLVDKLDAGLSNTKIDVMQTMLECVRSYHVDVISEYSTLLWDSLKYEIFNSQEVEPAATSIDIFQAVAARLCQDQNDFQISKLSTTLDPLIRDCLEHLQQPEHKQAKPAGLVLSAVTKVAAPALLAVVQAVLPDLLALYHNAGTIERRRALLDLLLLLLESALCVYGPDVRDWDFTLVNPIEPFKDQILGICSQTLTAAGPEDEALKTLALRSLLTLCQLRATMHSEEIATVTQCFQSIAVDDSIGVESALRNAAVQGLVHVSQVKPQLILDVIVPCLLTFLPDTGTHLDGIYLKSLDTMASLSTNQALSDVIVRRIFGRLNAALENSMPTSYCEALLSSLCFSLDQVNYERVNFGTTYQPKIMELFRLGAGLSISQQMHPFISEATFNALGQLAGIAIRRSGSDFRAEVAQHVYDLYTGTYVFITPAADSRLSRAKRLTIILSTHLIAALPTNVSLTIPANDLDQLLKDLMLRYLVEESSGISYFLLEHMALIVNKFVDKANLQAILMIVEHLVADLRNGGASLPMVRIVFWVSKALLLRSFCTDTILSMLIGLLSDTRVGNESARGFEILLSDSGMLSKANNANIRLLAKQQVFAYCVRAIREALAGARGQPRLNHLTALCALIRNTDSSIIMLEVDAVLPLVLQSLALPESGSKSAALETLSLVGQEKPLALEEHLSSVVSRLLDASQHRQENDAHVRFKALQCLCSFPGRLRDMVLVPHLTEVERGLVAPLDDPRRDVRKQAVDCKAAWSNVEEADMDE